MQNWYDLIVNKYLEFNNMIGKANLLVYQILFKFSLKTNRLWTTLLLILRVDSKSSAILLELFLKTFK